MNNNCILLGYEKNSSRPEGRGAPIFLYDFSWECDWYWGGGYLGNKNLHCHFDDCFLNVPDIRGHSLGNFVTPWTKLEEWQKGAVVIQNGAAIWEDLGFFLAAPAFNTSQWWRIKDLFKQFYALRDAAEVFRCGGHCTSSGRTEQEINPDMALALNRHLAQNIIPLIRKETGLDKSGSFSPPFHLLEK